MNQATSYNRYPFIELDGKAICHVGWEKIIGKLAREIGMLDQPKTVVAVECYQGVMMEEVERYMVELLDPAIYISPGETFKGEKEIWSMVTPDLTDDRVFGYLSRLNMEDYLDNARLKSARERMASLESGLILVLGPGASMVCEQYDLLVYADMARWEIQQRMRTHRVDNLGVSNREEPDWMLLYKHGFFVDWRVCDRLKKKLFDSIDFILDTNDMSRPKLIRNSDIMEGYRQAVHRPFSVVPFFDPGPWGGQWMKERFGLEKEVDNYAWCFNCVPEENSILFKAGEELIELPSINLVFRHPEILLGQRVHARFGDEFPIRFDFLDTMDGGNLSLQVHPLTEYIQEKFGLHYTQDESYYLMDATDGAVVYLGLKEGINRDECISELKAAQNGGEAFTAGKHIQTWPVKKHDHVLIPAGTVHGSGVNSMVLEVSATPYIFTFKLWDWGRLGMDGKPRPVHIGHGSNVIQWNRTEEWTRQNLVNRIEPVASGDGWVEERTGLHEREFIETRRHWFTKSVPHDTGHGVEVICLVEGEEVIVECPESTFDPFVVHYAEVFIIPAGVKRYTIRPYGRSEGEKCATLKAYVR